MQAPVAGEQLLSLLGPMWLPPADSIKKLNDSKAATVQKVFSLVPEEISIRKGANDALYHAMRIVHLSRREE